MATTLFTTDFSQVDYNELTPADRTEISSSLELEYRGEGFALNLAAIAGKITDPGQRERLKQFAVLFNVYEKVVKIKASDFVTPPEYKFAINGVPIGEKLQEYINEKLEELQFNTRMLEYERNCVYCGTVLVTPAINPRNNKLSLLKLTPTCASLQVKEDPMFSETPVEVSYETAVYIEDEKYNVKHVWNEFNHTVINLNTNDLIEETNHEYGEVPFAILRFKNDSSRFWGPVDQESYKFLQWRAIAVADALLTTYADQKDILVLTGFKPEEIMSATRSFHNRKVLMCQMTTNSTTGEPRPSQTAEYITPNRDEATKKWEMYVNGLRHYYQNNGIYPRNFEQGSQPQSGIAQTNSDQYAILGQKEKKPILAQFVKDLWKLIIHKNNEWNKATGWGMQIPEDTKISLNWPDLSKYTTIKDKLDDYSFKLQNHLVTIPDLIRLEDPDLTEQGAQERHEANKEWFEQQNQNIEDKTEEQDSNSENETKEQSTEEVKKEEHEEEN